MKHTEEEVKNFRLKRELSNSVYDTVGSAISVTAKKHNYKKYDIFKLVAAIYAGEYGYVTGQNDFRMQVKLLDEYFRKEYGHSIMLFEMIKAIIKFKPSKVYEAIGLDIAAIETIIRTGKENVPENPGIFSDYIKNEQYEELFKKMEEESSFRYAIMIVYDRLKRINREYDKNGEEKLL